MSRELKFKHIYGIDGKPETYFRQAFTIGEIESGCAMDVLCDTPLLREYRLLHRLQYTGLKDSKGVEIFEKDVIAYRDFRALVVWNDETAAFCSEADGRKSDHLYGSDTGWEVIGNILEHPELLEGGK